MKNLITTLLLFLTFSAYSQDVTVVHFNYKWNQKNDYSKLKSIKRASVSKAFVEEQGEERIKLLLGEPDDVGHMMVYLASDESKFVSGSEFVIDSTASITEGLVPG